MKFDFTGRRIAVVVVDTQWLFLAPDGPFANTDSQDVVAGVNAVTEICRRAGWPVVHSRYVLDDDLANAGLLSELPAVAQGLLCRSAAEAAIDPRITVGPGDRHSEHARPSAFYGSDLDAHLAELGIEAIVLAGVSANNAVSATARDAFARDLPVLIPREAVAPAPGEPHADLYLEILDTWTADVRAMSEIAAIALEAAPALQLER